MSDTERFELPDIVACIDEDMQMRAEMTCENGYHEKIRTVGMEGPFSGAYWSAIPGVYHKRYNRCVRCGGQSHVGIGAGPGRTWGERW